MRLLSIPTVEITWITLYLYSYVSDCYPGAWWAFAVEMILIISLSLSLPSTGETIMTDFILFLYFLTGMPLREGLSERTMSNFLKIYSGKVTINVAIQISCTSSFSLSPRWIYSCFSGNVIVQDS